MQDYLRGDQASNVEYINSCPKSTYLLGLDSSMGTYITDYIVAVVCIYFAEVFRRISRKSKELISDDYNEEEIKRKNSIQKRCYEELVFWAHSHQNTFRSVANAMTGSLVGCALMHLLAGLSHHLINHVEITNLQYGPLDELKPTEFSCLLVQVLPIYFLWQTAKLFASTFALFFVLTAFYIMLCKANQSQDIFPTIRETSISDDSQNDDFRDSSFGRRGFLLLKKHERTLENVLFVGLCGFCLFHICVAASATIQLTLSMGKVSKYHEIEQIWTLETMTYIIAACLSIYMIISIVLSFDQLQMRKINNLIDSGPETSRHELLSSFTDESNTEETSLDNSRRHRSNTVNDVYDIRRINSNKVNIYLTRCIGTAIMIIAGFTQYFLSFRCGLCKPEDVECPLPTYFNHNALYHLLFLFGIVIVCFAERRNLAREAQVFRKVKEILRIR